jgi:hypothetical protein
VLIRKKEIRALPMEIEIVPQPITESGVDELPQPPAGGKPYLRFGQFERSRNIIAKRLPDHRHSFCRRLVAIGTHGLVDLSVEQIRPLDILEPNHVHNGPHRWRKFLDHEESLPKLLASPCQVPRERMAGQFPSELRGIDSTFSPAVSEEDDRGSGDLPLRRLV